MYSQDVDTCYNAFLNILTKLLQEQTYKKVISKNNEPKNIWLTDHIKMLCGIKRQLYEGVINGRLDREIYTAFCDRLKKEIELTKRQSYERYIRNPRNLMKGTWHVINNIQGKAKHEQFDVEPLQDLRKNATDVLNEMNDYFVDIPDSVGGRFGATASMRRLPETFSLYLSDAVEVLAAIMDLNDTPSVGKDEVPVVLLKHCASEIAAPLAHIINMSFLSGIFPKQLKYTIIKPIHKKGDKSKIENYRPIALIPNISKVIEKIVLKRIMHFVNKHNIVSFTQNGYLKQRSTTRAMYQLLEGVINGLSEKECTACTLLDLSRAFDSVNHTVLLGKLDMMGFRGVVLDWLQSYLADRHQCVTAWSSDGRELFSEWAAVQCGVPQGSILGPLLYLLYVNDLPRVVEAPLISYADDTSLVTTSSGSTEAVENIAANLKKMIEWFTEHNLKLNIAKTNIIKFGGTSETLELNYENTMLTTTNEASFLGWKLDSELSWRPHVDQLAGKLSSACYGLRVLSRHVGPASAKIAYYANVYSRLAYGIIFWGNSVDAGRLFVLQKSCVRAIFNMSSRESCAGVFKEQRLLTLPSVFVLECACFVKANYLDFFKKYELEHGYSTRGTFNNVLLPPSTHLTKAQKSVIYQCIKIFNYLPVSFKALPYKLFKYRLKSVLIERAIYKIDDFFTNELC